MTVPLTGKLRTWNDARGFGFIAPTNGSPELFVHVSAFPADGSRPTEGETLTYELGRGKDGRPQAVRVVRTAVGVVDRPSRTPTHRAPRRSSLGIRLTVLVCLGVIGAFAFQKYRDASRPPAPPLAQESAVPLLRSPPATASRFQCDGRTHCSQMTSCEEAKYFLQHCPGTKMDGNNDGVPCESQWCK